jgi:hypothetical protein
MAQLRATAADGLSTSPPTVPAPANTAELWTLAWRTNKPPPPIVTNPKPQTQNHRNIMPKPQPANPPSSAAASLLSELSASILNYVRAVYPGLYLVSAE